MKRLAYVSAWLSLCGLLLLALSPAGAQDDKDPDIKAIMGKLNKGPMALTKTLQKDLNADTPDWDKIRKDAKDFTKLAEALRKNKPPKGEGTAWAQQTTQYINYAKALSEAAEKKDKDAAKAAHKKLSTACKSCHSQHKG